MCLVGKLKKIYYADFETTQPTNNKVEVYLWCIVSGKFNKYGDSIESFIDLIKTLKGVIYFHNLKFDFSYIHYFCLRNNIKLQILEKKGTLYSIKLYDVELRDSMNFLPITLKEIGENYCEKNQKTSIDYEVYTPHKPSQEEIDYCFMDCRVLEEGLTKYLNTVVEVLNEANATYSASKVFKKITNAGIAFEAFKELSDFDRICPKTTQFEYNAFKTAYKGGYVYSKPCGVVKDVQMIDCNSMYPYIYSNLEMPYGKPFKFINEKDKDRYKFYIININIKYDLKDGYIPIIGGGVGKYGSTIYKRSSNGDYENLTLCNIDFDLIKQFYNIEYEFNWGCGFETKDKMFYDYCQVFLKVKNANKGCKRNVAKVMLNSPYGKTAMNGLTEIKKWFIDDKFDVVKSEVVGYSVDDNVFQYLPIAIQITAGARRLLLETACKIGFDNVYYMDTDSIKFKYKETGINYNGDVLGDWKDEGRCELFKTIAPKKYVYYYNGVINFTCAGFNKKVLSEVLKHKKEVSYEEALQLMTKFDKGLEIECLQSMVVEGGRALLKIKKEIK